MKFFTTLLFCCGLMFANAQNNKYACTTDEAKQFDFWIGEWNLSWNDTSTGTNHITKEYGSCVIHENFSSPLDNFYGQSFTVYNAAKKQWQQTWIDSQNSYLLFNGAMQNNEMILTLINSANADSKRMRFTGISPNAFDWYWELSKDDGKSWTTLWLIHYKRKKDK